MKLLAARVDNINEALLVQLSPFLSLEMQVKLQNFHFFNDKIRSLFGELLVRIHAIEHLNIPNNQIEFVRNEHGKPALLGYQDYHFNVSHSGQWVVAVFDTSPVGIDIEQIRPIDLTIANRFFHEIETLQLYEQPSDQRYAYFYKLWTLKESYIKAVGKGLSIPLNSFFFSFIHGEIKLHTYSELNTWYFQQYEIDSYYKLSVCGNSPYLPQEILITDWYELVNRFEKFVIQVK